MSDRLDECEYKTNKIRYVACTACFRCFFVGTHREVRWPIFWSWQRLHSQQDLAAQASSQWPRNIFPILPLRTLHSCPALFDENGQVHALHGSGPASAAVRRLRSWGSHMEHAEEFETGPALFIISGGQGLHDSRSGWCMPSQIWQGAAPAIKEGKCCFSSPPSTCLGVETAFSP